jgi:hypothetical protein
MERSYAAPMDFEWQNKQKLDMTSPFAQLSQKTQESVFGKKRALQYPSSSHPISPLTESSGTHSDFASPSKADPLALREPNSQPFLFSLTPKKTPLRTPSFTTPQNNGKFDLDFSSGPENLSSPDQADADNEDTPEPKSSVLFKGTALSDKRHHPMFGRYGASPGPGPGRGEIPRGNYSHVVAKRVQKRRRRDEGRDRQLARRMSVDSDEDSRARRPDSSSSDATTKQNTVSWLFSLIESHPRMPYILSWYMQLSLNAFLILVSMRIVWSAWSTIVSDVDKASAQAAATALAEINQCARDYVSNRCGVPDRPPALHQVCENWSQCMNLNPEDVKRSQVTAAMFAGILNGFVDPISWKTMVCNICNQAPPPLPRQKKVSFTDWQTSRYSSSSSYQPRSSYPIGHSISYDRAPHSSSISRFTPRHLIHRTSRSRITISRACIRRGGRGNNQGGDTSSRGWSTGGLQVLARATIGDHRVRRRL